MTGFAARHRNYPGGRGQTLLFTEGEAGLGSRFGKQVGTVIHEFGATEPGRAKS